MERATYTDFQILCGELLLPVEIIHEDNGLRLLVRSGATVEQIRDYLTNAY